MRYHRSLLIEIALFASSLLITSCSGISTANASDIVLVGSTPADAAVKGMLTIPIDKPVDFVRWELALKDAPKRTFNLSINFGEAQPNTKGFKNGGEMISLSGEYSISKTGNREIFQLKGEKVQTPIRLVRLNENLFHLVTPDHKLMVGNGGWNYTLTREGSGVDSSTGLPSFIGPDEKLPQMVFTGRTPCFDRVSHDNLDPGQQCQKIKWKITFFRDAKTGEPTTFALQYTLERPNTVQGRWTVTKGTKGNPEAVLYNLIREKPGESISLLAGDENVLFFLDKEQRLLPGTEDFSFTLNRQLEGHSSRFGSYGPYRLRSSVYRLLHRHIT